ISPNSDWTYAGTGDPQMPDTWYLMCGDTSGSVENYNYTLGDFGLEYAPIPEPVTMAGLALGIGCLTRYVRRRRAAGKSNDV
ncbi:MAG TPA: PEP-CTERM sorting domain-containing protein, partial [Phycisphaerae bacterium]|nr:PEP-CTERM sorting domain-containing protein [Phycisphaerae bacterium]